MTSVTLCVPAWQSEDTVGRAIESALGQTHGDTRVLISVDESQDGTAEVCRRYAGDPRVELVVHDRRLGWAGNVNFCLGRIETDAVAMVFHDDWVEPQYCEVLTGMLEADPETMAVTGAVAHHGDISRTTFFEDAVGPLYDRLLQFFKRPQSRYTLKAMHRAQVFRDGLRLQDDGGAGFQIDVPFSMHVLLQGAFRKTDEVLYRKRMDASSVSAGWRRLDADEYFARQVEIRARLVEILAMTPLSDAEKMSLTAVILSTVNRDLVAKSDARDAAAWHARVAAALAIRLAGGQIARERLPEAVAAFRGEQLRQRAWLLRQDGHEALADAEATFADALEGEGGPKRAIDRAAGLLKPPRTPERIAAAREAAEEATTLAPSNVSAWVSLARALHVSGEEDEARAAASRAEALRGEPIPGVAAILGRDG